MLIGKSFYNITSQTGKKYYLCRMNQRIRYIDTAKGICICLVVAFHCNLLHYSEGLDNMLGVIRMPLYYFLSGLFFKLYDGYGSFVVKKVNRLLIPFLFFYLLTSVLLPNILYHFLGYNFETVVGWRSLYAFIYPEEFPNIPIWFLWSLFVSNIIFYAVILSSKGRESILFISVFILGLAGFALNHFHINLPAFIDNSLLYAPFFFSGHYAWKRGYLQSTFSRASLGFALPVLLVISYVLSNLDADCMWVQMPCFWISGIAGIFFVLFLSRLVDSLPLITYYGRYSIMILVSHLVVIQCLQKLWMSFLPNVQLSDTLIFIATLLLSLLLIPLMKKYIPYFVAQKDLLHSI